MGHYTEIPVPFPVLSTFFFSGPRQFVMGYLIRAGPVTSSLISLLSPLTRQGNDWGLVWGLWVTILKNLFGTMMFPLHSQSYSIINLVLGHYTEFFTTGLLGMTGGLGYILCLSLSSGHYTDVFILFPSLYWPVISLFRPIRVTILENFRIVRGLILNSSAFHGKSFKIPLG